MTKLLLIMVILLLKMTLFMLMLIRLLRQRIDTLENESSELADRLIQVNTSIFLSFDNYLPVFYVYLSICLSINLSSTPSIYLSIYQSNYLPNPPIYLSAIPYLIELK